MREGAPSPTVSPSKHHFERPQTPLPPLSIATSYLFPPQSEDADMDSDSDSEDNDLDPDKDTQMTVMSPPPLMRPPRLVPSQTVVQQQQPQPLSMHAVLEQEYVRQRAKRIIRLLASFLDETAQNHTLSRLLFLDHWSFGIAASTLHKSIHLGATNIGTFLSTIISRAAANPERHEYLRSSGHRITIHSLPRFAPPIAAYVGTSVARAPLVPSSLLAIKSGAWESIGGSTLMCETVTALASPRKVCFDVGADIHPLSAVSGAESTPATRLAALSIATTLLPNWDRLRNVTIHHAHVLLTAGKFAQSIFISGIHYTLLFGVSSPPWGSGAESATVISPKDVGRLWQGMTSVLRPILSLFVGTVVIPYDRHGTLMPQIKGANTLEGLPDVARSVVDDRHSGPGIRFTRIELMPATCPICLEPHRQ